MRILVVEDEANILEYLVRHLRDEGYAVNSATDGEEALALATTRPYDLITLDILLPKMNGYEVCRQLRARGITTPILMLTAKDGEYDEVDALDMGADDFLRKPFSLLVLDARLRSLLRRNAQTRTNVLQLDDLTLDTRTHEVTRAGRRIDLTPREFSLLEYLLHRQGIITTKEQILEHVWGLDHPLSNNVVEVYVGYLRKKIDAPYQTKLLSTIRGVGYKMG